ncbi:MAG: Glu/Leu/Phe/Val dehydrogenase [bacterium]|nr:Glu/Leu/Phe/Val dehydrogenase [bacterium]
MKEAIQKDEFGPEYVIDVYDPRAGMEGFLVIDNTALGLGKGGIRMTPNVTREEVSRLARAMTFKNAIAGIPFGGAKAGMIWKGGSTAQKKKAVVAFAKAIKYFIPHLYVAGPDVNSGEREMQWIAEAVECWQAATGKPSSYCYKKEGKLMCGLPHELGSTGFGVAIATRVALPFRGIEMKGATCAIDGFGNVGSFAFLYLHQMGARIVAVSDKEGAIYKKEGLDGSVLNNLKKKGKSVISYPGATAISHTQLFHLPVDVLIPASVTDVIHEKNQQGVKAKIIVQGANIPMQEHIEERLVKRGILIVPDIVANAGGVISSYAEYKGYSADHMRKLVKEKIEKSVEAVLKVSEKNQKNPRDVARDIAMNCIRSAMRKKRL